MFLGHPLFFLVSYSFFGGTKFDQKSIFRIPYFTQVSRSCADRSATSVRLVGPRGTLLWAAVYHVVSRRKSVTLTGVWCCRENVALKFWDINDDNTPFHRHSLNYASGSGRWQAFYIRHYHDRFDSKMRPDFCLMGREFLHVFFYNFDALAEGDAHNPEKAEKLSCLMWGSRSRRSDWGNIASC